MNDDVFTIVSTAATQKFFEDHLAVPGVVESIKTK